MTTRSLCLWLLFAGLIAGATALVRQSASAAPDAPEVAVCHPEARQMVDYDDFVGHVEAAQSVEIRARVSGYLEKIFFKEGMTVKRGDALFQIDSRPYRAELDKADAEVALGEARLKLVVAQLERARALPPGAISAQELLMIESQRTEATAAIQAVRAARIRTQLTLSFTTVASPIDGRIGRALLSVGNIVQADTTQLTTLISIDPVYVHFDMDERSALRRAKLHRDGKLPSEVVSMALADEKDWPRKGRFESTDIRIDPANGTLRCRAVFDNPDGLLIPGLFARVRLAAGEPYKVLLVPESAIWIRGETACVWVVNESDTIIRRDVRLGQYHNDQRAVKEGLAVKDRVVTDRDKVKDAQKVKPKLVELPLPPESKRP